MKTDNKYNNMDINTYDDAIEIIHKDFDEQSWLCENNIDISRVEYDLEDYEEAYKLNEDKIGPAGHMFYIMLLYNIC